MWQPDLYGKLNLAPLLVGAKMIEMEAKHVQNLLTRHNTQLKQLYRFYAAYKCPAQDAFVMTKGCSLKKVPRRPFH